MVSNFYINLGVTGAYDAPAAEMDPSIDNARRFILGMREELEAREGP